MTVGRCESPEDFVVEEIPLYEPCGEGEHTFLWVEKRLRDSEEVARFLAREAGVPPRDVGYAGRKDRMAVTRQHFSVPDLDATAAVRLAMPGVRVLRAVRHRHKLRTGQLAGNRFDIRVSGLDPAVVSGALSASLRMERIGMPNRFGDQRFGRGGGNVERGRQLLAGRPAGRDRRSARFLLSALQAAIFNEVLATRALPLDEVEPGDLAQKTDSGGIFLVEDLEVDRIRAARFEISPTGPIIGTRMDEPRGEVAARERAAILRFGVEYPVRAPRGIRLRGARRPLRVPVRDLRVEPIGESGVHEALRLRFSLPAGSYATVLLEELLGFQPQRGTGSGAPSDPPEP